MTAHLCLGANLGDPVLQISTALQAIETASSIRILKTSAMILTPPYGKTDQPAFWNQALIIETELLPHNLLDTLLKIENKMGRVRAEHWGPRLIDIDILLFEDQIINTEKLIIPHPDFHNREFALRLMNEIAPELEHPVLHKTMSALYEELAGREDQ